MKVTYFLNLSNSIDKMMMRTFLQCVQYLRLTSGPKRKNEYNNFCFLRRVEVLEKREKKGKEIKGVHQDIFLFAL